MSSSHRGWPELPSMKRVSSCPSCTWGSPSMPGLCAEGSLAELNAWRSCGGAGILCGPMGSFFDPGSDKNLDVFSIGSIMKRATDGKTDDDDDDFCRRRRGRGDNL